MPLSPQRSTRLSSITRPVASVVKMPPAAISRIALRSPSAASAQPQTEAAGTFDDAVENLCLAEIRKVDQASVAADRVVGAVQDQTGELNPSSAVGRQQRPFVCEHDPRRSWNADEPRPSGRRRFDARIVPAGNA
jgi:hypothetical protein